MFLLLPPVSELRVQSADGTQFTTLHYGMSGNDSYLKRRRVLARNSQSAPWQQSAVVTLANYNPFRRLAERCCHFCSKTSSRWMEILFFSSFILTMNGSHADFILLTDAMFVLIYVQIIPEPVLSANFRGRNRTLMFKEVTSNSGPASTSIYFCQTSSPNHNTANL